MDDKPKPSCAGRAEGEFGRQKRHKRLPFGRTKRVSVKFTLLTLIRKLRVAENATNQFT